MLSHGILHPLDTVKVLRQVYPGAYHGIIPGVNYLMEHVGVRALYRGWGPAIIGGAISSSIYFGVYEGVRRRLGRLQLNRNSRARTGSGRFWERMSRNTFAAACGNFVSSSIFVPKEVLKQRMMIGHLGLRETMGELSRTGWRAWYAGWGSTMVRNVPSNVVRFAMYEEMKWAMEKWRSRNGLRRKLGRLDYILAGGVPGALASAITTPMDVLKTKFATGSVEGAGGIPAAMTTIIRKRGVAGLFAGVRPRVLWAACFSALGFSFYELAKDVLVPDHSKKRNILHKIRFH